jgi:hypothetical protein
MQNLGDYSVMSKKTTSWRRIVTQDLQMFDLSRPIVSDVVTGKTLGLANIARSYQLQLVVFSDMRSAASNFCVRVHLPIHLKTSMKSKR